MIVWHALWWEEGSKGGNSSLESESTHSNVKYVLEVFRE